MTHWLDSLPDNPDSIANILPSSRHAEPCHYCGKNDGTHDSAYPHPRRAEPSVAAGGDDLNGGMHASIFVKVWGDAGGGDAGRIALANYAYELGRRAALASPAVPEGCILVPVNKLTVGDCYRFGVDINIVRNTTQQAVSQMDGAAAQEGDLSVGDRVRTLVDGWTSDENYANKIGVVAELDPDGMQGAVEVHFVDGSGVICLPWQLTKLAPATQQAGADGQTADIEAIADELEAEASNYEGDFADTVMGCVEALRKLASSEATTASASGESLYRRWAHQQPNRASIPSWDRLLESTRAHWNKQAIHGRAQAPSREAAPLGLREALELCIKALEHAGIGKATREAALDAARAALAQQNALDDNEVARLRRVVRALGMEKEVPEDAETLRGCLFSVLGMIARKLEVLATHAANAGEADKHLPGWEGGIATVTLTGHQLRAALDFLNPDGDDDPDQRDDDLTFGIVQHKDDGTVSTGMCCWNDDSDGVMPLESHPDERAAIPSSAAQEGK